MVRREEQGRGRFPGVLTADINLGKYAWLNISSSKKVVLDGASFEVTGLERHGWPVCADRLEFLHP